LFFDRLEAALILARRSSSLRLFVILIDIDRLQTVNESLGMSFGDSALLTVARRAARDLLPGDTLARLGGDQFGVIAIREGEAAPAARPARQSDQFRRPRSLADGLNRRRDL
jgi:diguanylate cyclase (GGDEF)-like protein